jgi:hypothetical protein
MPKHKRPRRQEKNDAGSDFLSEVNYAIWCLTAYPYFTILVLNFIQLSVVAEVWITNCIKFESK